MSRLQKTCFPNRWVHTLSLSFSDTGWVGKVGMGEVEMLQGVPVKMEGLQDRDADCHCRNSDFSKVLQASLNMSGLKF